MEIYVQIDLISIFFSFCLVFNYDFIIYIGFTRIVVSSTAADDVTNSVMHRIFNTNL